MAAIGGIPHKCCCYCHTNWRHHCHGLGPRAYLFITFRRNISAWIGVRSRDLLNICENDIMKNLVFIVTKNCVEFCLKWVLPTSMRVWKSWEFTGGWSESWKGCFACLMSFCQGKNWQHVSGNVMLPTVCQAVNAPNSAPVRVIEVIYDFIALFKIHLVIPYYFTNWPASKAINKAVDKSVINQ